MHAGIAPELAKALAGARIPSTSAGAWRSRPPSSRRPRVTSGRVSSRSFEQLLSIAGAGALLSIALLGPVGTVVLATTTAIAFVVTMRPRRSVRRRASVPAEPWVSEDPSGRAAPGAPEASDRWRLWRVVEADREYLQRRAA